MGYTCNIDTSKYKIFKDGKAKKNLIDFKELKTIIDEVSPVKKENIVGRLSEYTPIHSISELITALNSIKERYGDIPIWEYDTSFAAPKHYYPTFEKIVITNKYSWSQYNTKHQEVHIENLPALIIIK